MKSFTTTGPCIPSVNYMVDLSERVNQIKDMNDEGQYFTITRGRQYGKTTTLNHIYQNLKSEYLVLNLSFEGIGNAGFESEQAFVKAFCMNMAVLNCWNSLTAGQKNFSMNQ